METLAAIDIGSNAMRLVVARVLADGSYKIICTHREPVRLGHDVFRLRRITPSLMDRAVASFLHFETILRKHKVKIIRAVGTSALRDATNSKMLIDRVARATGITLEVISGDEEARLIQLAVAGAINIKTGTKLLIDIGGGSVEVTLLHRGRLVFADSVPLGTVRLLEMLRGRKQPTLVLQRLIRQYALGVRRRVRRAIGSEKITCAIGTGGNLETLGELRKRILGETSDTIIRRHELQSLLTLFQRKTLAERIDELKLRPDRADVIVPATALLIGILRESRVSTLRIPKVGLREGILVDLIQRSNARLRIQPSPRTAEGVVSSALRFAKRFNLDEQHAKHVTKLCLQLFDQLRSVHKLGADARMVLQLAALLHDVGHYINPTDHHKHSGYILSKTLLSGIADIEQKLIATVARYHTGSSPSLEHPEWRCLNTKQRATVQVLAGILRIVEELDKEHLRRVTTITVRRMSEKITLKLAGKGPLLVERWGAQRRKQLLEKVLRSTIEIT